MTVQKSLQTHVSAKKKAKVGGLIVGFIFYLESRFLTANSSLTERINQTLLICGTEPSEL